MKWVAVLVLLAPLALHAADARYCYAELSKIPRDADGKIIRSAAVRAAFSREHPCPETGEVTGACQKWEVDHTVPLSCGGCDAVENMAWMPKAIKSGPGKLPKDRWEQKVYCKPPQKVVLK